MAYKQQPKSPMLKALKGNQGKLPQHLQDAIKAAPESPAKQTKKAHTDEMGRKGHFNPTTARTKGDRLNSRADTESTYPNKYQNAIVKPTSRASGYSKKVGYQEDNMRRTHKYDTIISGRANAYSVKENNFGIKKPKASIKSPAKQTTAGEFAHKKSIKDKEMGKSTKAVDKVKAAYDAMTTDKTYADAKKGYRKAAKKAYDAKSPAKVKDPVTGSKVKGYAKSDRKVDNARMKQDLKESKKAKLKTAKEDGKVTRLERKGIRESQKDMRNKKVNETNTKFQKQKVKDKAHKERTRVRNVARKASDAVKVGLSEGEASSRVGKALDKANRRVDRAKSKAARKTRSK